MADIDWDDSKKTGIDIIKDILEAIKIIEQNTGFKPVSKIEEKRIKILHSLIDAAIKENKRLNINIFKS